MADPEHIEILKQGAEVWNRWRGRNFVHRPDTSNLLDLSRADFSGINLNGAELFHVNFSGADLRGAVLRNTDFTGADLSYANLQRAAISADFGYADLRGADLTRSTVVLSTFEGTRLKDANFLGARFNGNKFTDTDISVVKNLESVKHLGPSSIGVDTVYKSQGNIPESFLRGCGVPDELIIFMHSLVAHPIQFYSCFISYSSKDQPFAERLYADLQNKGVRCWFAPEDLKIGAEIRTGIDESIRVHDKLLLVLSETSVKSQWVQQEVETALANEREQGRTVLFPIRLDDVVMQINTGWPAYLKNTRNIGDFRRWKQHDTYQKAFDRLLRDLKAEEKQA